MPDRYAAGKSFDPATAQLMREAFESAWKSVQETGSVDAALYRSEWARETLALRIIEMTERGERNIDRLRSDALAYLSNAKPQKLA